MLKPIIAIVVAVTLSMLIALAGSNNSALFDGMPIFMLCASVGFVLHWLGFIPAYVFQTEHYFDLIGSRKLARSWGKKSIRTPKTWLP